MSKLECASNAKKEELCLKNMFKKQPSTTENKKKVHRHGKLLAKYNSVDGITCNCLNTRGKLKRLRMHKESP